MWKIKLLAVPPDAGASPCRSGPGGSISHVGWHGLPCHRATATWRCRLAERYWGRNNHAQYDDHPTDADRRCGGARGAGITHHAGRCRAAVANLAGSAERRRCGRPVATDARRHGRVRESQSEAGIEDFVLAGAGPRIAGQDQGAAGRRPGGYRSGADRHRRTVCRHRHETLDPAGDRLRVRAAEPAGHLPAGRVENAGPRAKPGGVRRVLSRRSDHRIHAGCREAGAEEHTGTAGLGQGASQAVHLRATRQFGARPNVPAGPALSAARHGPDGPQQRLGQDLGLPRRTRQVHRILSDRHWRGDEGAGGRLPRHDRLASRLGPQPAHPWRGAEGGAGRHAGRLPLGNRRAVPGRSRKACRTTSWQCCST